MKLEDYRADYYLFSTKTSEIVRQLSFAGIAFIWLLKPSDGGVSEVPAPLLLPAALFMISLGFDLLQSAFGTLLWGYFCRFQECNDVKDDDELDTPSYYNWPNIFFFWSKIILLIVAYSLALHYVFSLIKLP